MRDVRTREESHKKAVTSSQLHQAAEREIIHHREGEVARTTKMANPAKRCISGDYGS